MVERYPLDGEYRKSKNFPHIKRGAPAGAPGRKRRKDNPYKLPKKGPPVKKPLRPNGPKKWPVDYPSPAKKAAMRKGFSKIARLLGGAALKSNPYTGAFSWAWDAYDIAGNVYGWATDSQGVISTPGSLGMDTDHYYLYRFCEDYTGYAHDHGTGATCGSGQYVSVSDLSSPGGSATFGWPTAHGSYITLQNLKVDYSATIKVVTTAEVWRQIAGTPPTPSPTIQHQAVFLPLVFPQTELTFEFPLEWPYPQSWADAVALPGSQPDGSPDPSEQPSRRDAQQATQRVPVVPGVRVLVLPDVGVVPVTDTQMITVPPGTDITTITYPPPETVSRPASSAWDSLPEHVKERKVRMYGKIAGTWTALNMATEGVDFLFVLHDALPKEYQAKKKSGWSKPAAHDAATAVYMNWHRIDVGKAVENYVNEWMEDMFYAGLGRAGKNLNQLTGAPTGGGRALNNNASEFGEGNPVKPPEMTLDVETGHWMVETPFGSFYGSLGG